MNTLDAAVAALRRGGIVAYPTEAVYGLGCDPLDEAVVHRLLALKRRPVEKGLILIAADTGQLSPYVGAQILRQYPHVLESWPGPNTWLLPCRDGVPRWLRGDFVTLALRVTAHPLAAELCGAFGGALVSTSANLAGQPPARTADEVRERLPEGVDYILEGKTGDLAQPTPIRDAATGEQLR